MWVAPLVYFCMSTHFASLELYFSWLQTTWAFAPIFWSQFSCCKNLSSNCSSSFHAIFSQSNSKGKVILSMREKKENKICNCGNGTRKYPGFLRDKGFHLMSAVGALEMPEFGPCQLQKMLMRDFKLKIDECLKTFQGRPWKYELLNTESNVACNSTVES